MMVKVPMTTEVVKSICHFVKSIAFKINPLSQIFDCKCKQ